MTHLLLMAAIVTLTVNPAAVQGPPQPQPPGPPAPVVITSGEGVVKRAPDRVWVTIAAESRAKTPREAQKANADAMAAVMAKLKELGLPADAIRTASYDLQPEFDYHEGKQTLRGYVARNRIEVRVDEIARAGEVLDAAVGSGATSVSGVRFDLKERARLEREALALAVADARARAETAARAAGRSAGEVLRIDEQRAIGPEPRPVMMAMRAGLQESAETPIAPGELEIRATVTLTTALK